MEHKTTLLASTFVTHDVRRFVVGRPDGFEWTPGQGVELAIDRDGWRDEGRPFTPTALADDRVLEFVIKAYPEHDGVTRRLHELAPGDGLRMSAPFGTLTYRGPGAFVAGGAGVTPFLAIVRRLARDGELDGHDLLFSNKTAADVICEKELRERFGPRGHFTLTRENRSGYASGRIDRELLAKRFEDFDRRFYVCGPESFVDDVRGHLESLGASSEGVVLEE